VLDTSKHECDNMLGLGPERLVKRENGMEVQVPHAHAPVCCAARASHDTLSRAAQYSKLCPSCSKSVGYAAKPGPVRTRAALLSSGKGR
jgi:hypothetical protein